jgi:hypothetical protein
VTPRPTCAAAACERGIETRSRAKSSIGAFTVRNGKIVELDFLADPERLRLLDLTILDD